MQSVKDHKKWTVQQSKTKVKSIYDRPDLIEHVRSATRNFMLNQSHKYGKPGLSLPTENSKEVKPNCDRPDLNEGMKPDSRKFMLKQSHNYEKRPIVTEPVKSHSMLSLALAKAKNDPQKDAKSAWNKFSLDHSHNYMKTSSISPAQVEFTDDDADQDEDLKAAARKFKSNVSYKYGKPPPHRRKKKVNRESELLDKLPPVVARSLKNPPKKPKSTRKRDFTAKPSTLRHEIRFDTNKTATNIPPTNKNLVPKEPENLVSNSSALTSTLQFKSDQDNMSTYSSDSNEVVFQGKKSKQKSSDASNKDPFLQKPAESSTATPQSAHKKKNMTKPAGMPAYIGSEYEGILTPEEFQTYFKPISQELQDLRNEEMKKIFQKKKTEIFEYPTATPEFMKMCRDGPANDPNSQFGQTIERTRLLARTVAAQTGAAPTILTEDVAEPVMTPGSREKMLSAQREKYKEGRVTYPYVSRGKLVLSPQSGPVHEEMIKMIVQAMKKFELEETPGAPPQWKNISYKAIYEGRWENIPHCMSNYSENRKNDIHRWLDSHVAIRRYSDIFHTSFFNGEAHADGVHGFHVTDFDYPPCRIDMDDEKTRLYRHETIEGYCQNLFISLREKEKEAEIEEQARRLRARQYFDEFPTSPMSPLAKPPRANIYLRPAADSDAQGLISIANWYIQNSTMAEGTKTLEVNDMHLEIMACDEARLPFIVAVERGAGARAREKIVGYSLMKDLIGKGTTAQYTAKMEVFVKPDYTKRGIGGSLMDKLVELSDPGYTIRMPHLWEVERHVTGYGQGGNRILASTVFCFSYTVDDKSKYNWVKDWLNKDFGFEEQGAIEGMGIKFGNFLCTSYLVRKVSTFRVQDYK